MLATIAVMPASGSGSRAVAFNEVSGSYYQAVKMVFGDNATVSYVTDSTPLPGAIRGLSANIFPAKVTAGQFAPALYDEYGRAVTTDTPLGGLISYQAVVTAASATLAASDTGYKFRLKYLRIHNRDAGRVVTVTLPANVGHTLRIPPKGTVLLEQCDYVGADSGAFALTISSAVAPLEITAKLIKERN